MRTVILVLKINVSTKPLENDDLATKQCSNENIGKLGEDLRKIITQSINRRLTKMLSLENKIELCNKRAYSADQIIANIFNYVTKPISLSKITEGLVRRI